MNKSIFTVQEITSNRADLDLWINDLAAYFESDKIYWCNGSDEEYNHFCQLLVDKGTFIKLHSYPER